MTKTLAPAQLVGDVVEGHAGGDVQVVQTLRQLGYGHAEVHLAHAGELRRL